MGSSNSREAKDNENENQSLDIGLMKSEDLGEITSQELRSIYGELPDDGTSGVPLNTVADCFAKYHLTINIEGFLEKYSKDGAHLTEDEFLEAFSNYYTTNSAFFTRPRSKSLEELDYLAKPPPELLKAKQEPSLLGPDDKIAEPMGPDTGENIPAVCSDCQQVYNYARGHHCPAMPNLPIQDVE